MSEGGATRCPYCGHEAPLVAVHGHEQCELCSGNVAPCCAGADPVNEAAATPGIAGGPEPHLFDQLFEQLGGHAATVTTDALLFALTQRLGTDLDDAKVVLEAAERVGVVARAGKACHRLRQP